MARTTDDVLRRELKEQHAPPLTEALSKRLDHRRLRIVGIEKALVDQARLFSVAGVRRVTSGGAVSMCLHQEAEVGWDRLRVGSQLRGGKRTVVTAVETHHTQQRVSGVSRQSLIRQHLLAGTPIVDLVLPAREGPR